MRTTRQRRGGSTGGVSVGRRCAAGDGLRDTSPVVYGGVDVQACSEERLLLAAGEARARWRGPWSTTATEAAVSSSTSTTATAIECTTSAEEAAASVCFDGHH
jgi:hypothetical protein